MENERWLFAADRGGTFTDIVAFGPNGAMRSFKLLSASHSYEDAVVEGMARLINKEQDPIAVEVLKLGTTIGTNALLEKKGAEVCLITTSGFADILEIGEQERPDIFALEITKAPLFYSHVIEVSEQINADGKIIFPLQKQELTDKLKKIPDQCSLAILLKHSWKNPQHEQKVAELAQGIGFRHITCSSEIMPLIKMVGRGRTTVVDAYITPVLKEYLQKTTQALKQIPVLCMQSNGVTTQAENFRGKDAILSGPAGGVVGFSHMAKLAGFDKAIGFDMGGTSTDVSRFDGNYEKVYEAEIAGARMQVDMLNVITVAAGGGSILQFDGEKMTAGPESAGAIPGPACYRRGGPLTITDANLALGRILPQFFAKVFGPKENQALDRDIVLEKFQKLANKINKDSLEVAEGFIRIANENMGQAVKNISVSHGFDIRDYALVCFGGAGGQHGCAIARVLGLKSVVLPPLAGILSAYGIVLADVGRTGACSLLLSYDKASCRTLLRHFSDLEKDLLEQVKAEGVASKDIQIKHYLDIRPRGTETAETVEWHDYDQTRQLFYHNYRQHYGIELPADKSLEIAHIRVEITGARFSPQLAKESKEQKLLSNQDAVIPNHEAFFHGRKYQTPVFNRSSIQPGNRIVGPAIIVDDHGTSIVEPEFQAEMNEYRQLILTVEKPAKNSNSSQQKKPVMLEIFNNLFRSVADQMGSVLLNTASSTNIKERRDFSCAVFDQDGKLVANAAHIPVHLGAMGETVQSIMKRNSNKMKPGDVYVCNNPYAGGSHLPDITIITPVFSPEQKLIFAVASRGHHADIGGITPGSMPPFSGNLSEEGIVFDNFLLVSQGHFREAKVIEVLRSGPFPARNIEERLSDLRAQIAANNQGVRELQQIIHHYGLEVTLAYMKYIQDNAAWSMRKVLKKLLGKKTNIIRTFTDYLDEGMVISVKITIHEENEIPRMKIDFSGTSQQMRGNLNAPQAVTKAAVLYVLRLLIEDNIPLNAGCLEPVDIHIPEGSLLNPAPGAAVAGGNVETSQRIVDVLCGALKICAASQGTMNNWTFGDESQGGFGYYETICGGSGAGPNFHGASAVHTHMTNTRITDPEILEQRYPEVMVKQFAVRRGSGGKGKFQGGDGVIRSILFRKKRQVTILSQRRSLPPYGLNGGQYGKRGLNILTKKDGEQALPSKVSIEIQPGEILTIYTPGGGGYGSSDFYGDKPISDNRERWDT